MTKLMDKKADDMTVGDNFKAATLWTIIAMVLMFVPLLLIALVSWVADKYRARKAKKVEAAKADQDPIS